MIQLSTDDLGVFFEKHHRKVARAALDFAESWSPRATDEDWRTREAAQKLADAGLLEHCVPPDGSFDVRALTLIREALGQVDGLLDTAFAMQGLGSAPITLAGTPSQRQRYLPDVRAGQSLGAFALTEPGAGSDVSAIALHARSVGNTYVLEGEKTFISNAGVAGQYVVFATVDPELGRKGITAFIVEPGDEGLEVERFEVIAPHPIGTLRFTDCAIPDSRRLGQEGEGFGLAMRTLDIFRTTVAGAALGMARRALDEGLLRAMSREQFGRPIADQQQVAAYLADSATELDAARLLVYRAARLKDRRSTRVSTEVAMAKLYATEAAQRIIDRALQIHGGSGVRIGSVVERLYREIRALRIYEGTSEIQRVIIASGIRKAVQLN